jgi:hypothetical protein
MLPLSRLKHLKTKKQNFLMCKHNLNEIVSFKLKNYWYLKSYFDSGIKVRWVFKSKRIFSFLNFSLKTEEICFNLFEFEFVQIKSININGKTMLNKRLSLNE